MINISTPKNAKTIIILFFFLTIMGHAQIGIGTASPNVSSILDITSTTKGLLAPRMTTAERIAITTPAESLLVYDTTVKAFYYYNLSTTSWVKIANESSSLRNNYKLVKSAADLAPELAAGGSSYLLTPNTYYEINGTITLAAPINLNNAYVSGLDTNEDILQAPGIVFVGNTGGSIRNVTLKGTSAFNIAGPGIATDSALLVQNTVISGMTGGVGSVSGLGLFFGNIVQFISNTGGITYSNIGNLLLSNQAWFSNNSGTFERFTGSFSLIQKNSGFSTVDGNDVAMDVSTLTNTAVGTGILIGTVFSGTTGATSGIINRYAASWTYPGYNFNTAWTVDAPGIPREGDSDATGDINFTATIGNGVTTTFNSTGSSGRKKISGGTASNNLFRFTRDGDNIITYRGNKTRYFQVAASVSYQTTADATMIFYIAKNGVALTETKVYGRASSGLLTTTGIVALPIIASVQMKNGDSIEIMAERYEGLGNLTTVSLNLTAR